MCDIQTAVAGIGGRKMDLDRECVQIAAIVGLTILGSVAIVYDGSVGEAIAVAVAGAIGFLARSIFGGMKDEAEEVQKP